MFKPVVVVLSSSDSEDEFIPVSSRPPPHRLRPLHSAAIAQPIASPLPTSAAPDRAPNAQVQTRTLAFSLGGPDQGSWIWVSGASVASPCYSKPNLCPGDDCELLSDDDSATTVMCAALACWLQLIVRTGARGSCTNLCSLDRPHVSPLC